MKILIKTLLLLICSNVILLAQPTINAITQPCTTGVKTDPRTTDWTPANNYPQEWMKNKFNWFSTIQIKGVGEGAYFYLGNTSNNNVIDLYSPFSKINCPPYLKGICSASAYDDANTWKPDMMPEDGWELIKQSFGFLNNANVSTGNNNTVDPGGFPYLMLYNKYKGVLRIIGYANTPGYNYVQVKLSIDHEKYHSGSGSNVTYDKFTGLFAFYGNIMQPLDQKAQNNEVSVFATRQDLTNYSGHDVNPFYADFQLAYDPCTCTLETGLRVDFILTEQYQLTALSTTITPDATTEPSFFASVLTNPTDSPSGTKGPDGSSLVTNTANNGIISFLSTELLEAKMKAYAGDQEADGLNISVKDGLEGLSSAITAGAGAAAFTGQEEVAAPLEAVAKIVDFAAFVAGQNSSPSSIKPTFSAIAGTVTKSNQASSVSLAMPGSQATIPDPGNAYTKDILNNEYNGGTLSTSASMYPMYNEVLGTFALLKTPDLKFNEVLANGGLFKKDGFPILDQGGATLTWQIETNSSNFQFVFNPTANVSKYKIYGAYDITMTYPDYYQQIGNSVYYPTSGKIDLTNLDQYWVHDYKGSNPSLSDYKLFKYSTKFLPIEDLTYNTPRIHFDDFYCYDTQNNPHCFQELTVKLKLIVITETNDKDQNGKPIQNILLLTYPLNVVDVTNSIYANNLCNPSPLSCEIPENLNLINVNFTTNLNVYAFSKVSIGNNVTESHSSGYPQVVINGGNSVEQVGESVLNGEFILQNAVPGASQGYQIPPVSSSDINNFCSKSTGKYQSYQPAVLPIAARVEASNKTENNDQSILSSRQFGTPNLTAIPNPTDGQVTFYYKVQSDGEVSIAINNVLGTKIADVLKNEFKSTGQYQKQLDLSQLPVGVYMVTIETNNFKQTERLVIAR